MTTQSQVPLPPVELRMLVGPRDPEDFDNPTGSPVYPGLPIEQYRSVFDFACGCGRMARKLMLMKQKPTRYVGIDVHKPMIDWCSEYLTPTDPNFRFEHHDVYSVMYAPGNSAKKVLPFPVEDGKFSLVIAHSIFTHINWRQSEHYLKEISRILTPDGIAYTTWFFFDNDSIPFLKEGPYNLFVDDTNLDLAVLHDRKWFLDTVRKLGLAVRSTTTPNQAGLQWSVWLEKRTSATVDKFPLGEEGAEWLCGATYKPMSRATDPSTTLHHKTGSRSGNA